MQHARSRCAHELKRRVAAQARGRSQERRGVRRSRQQRRHLQQRRRHRRSLGERRRVRWQRRVHCSCHDMRLLVFFCVDRETQGGGGLFLWQQ